MFKVGDKVKITPVKTDYPVGKATGTILHMDKDGTIAVDVDGTSFGHNFALSDVDLHYTGERGWWFEPEDLEVI